MCFRWKFGGLTKKPTVVLSNAAHLMSSLSSAWRPCVEGGLAWSAGKTVSKGFECTADVCDEVGRKIIHDASACECTADPQCAALNPSPCLDSVCNPDTSRCVTTPKDNGAPCDDGIECTVSTCDGSGQCVAEGDDALCDDGLFCNGAERCDPMAQGADALTGCVAGTPVADEADQGDCTVAVCDEGEDQVTFEPTDACECQAPEDCHDGTCQAFACDVMTGFSCEPLGDQRLPDLTPCDDGFECTAAGVCQEGVCFNEPVNALCSNGDPCDGEELCAPDADEADAQGCVASTPPDDPPAQCD